MKLFFTLLFSILHFFATAQCTGVQSFNLNPAPTPAGYAPGTVVNVCYTMNGWPGLNVGSNWLEGFDVNLGPGWTNLQPGAPPANCQGGGGNWVWLNANATPSGAVGPGWFFDSGINGPLNGNPADDWGDQGSCSWSFCFTVTVANTCVPQNLLIQVTAGADGDWGNWTNGACPTIPVNIYNGMVNITPFTLSAISHN